MLRETKRGDGIITHHIGWIIIDKSNFDNPVYAQGVFSVEEVYEIFPIMKKIIDPLADGSEKFKKELSEDEISKTD